MNLLYNIIGKLLAPESKYLLIKEVEIDEFE